MDVIIPMDQSYLDGLVTSAAGLISSGHFAEAEAVMDHLTGRLLSEEAKQELFDALRTQLPFTSLEHTIELDVVRWLGVLGVMVYAHTSDLSERDEDLCLPAVIVKACVKVGLPVIEQPTIDEIDENIDYIGELGLTDVFPRRIFWYVNDGLDSLAGVVDYVDIWPDEYSSVVVEDASTRVMKNVQVRICDDQDEPMICSLDDNRQNHHDRYDITLTVGKPATLVHRPQML